MSPTFAEGTVRVTTPATYDARRAAPDRGLPDPAKVADVAGHEALVAALRDSDLELVEPVALPPRRSRDLAPQPTGTVRLEVDVAHDQDAVVLLERDGLYSWHLPVAA